ncbi:RsmB/NOP family class I SAM-dependent RNA methyltransferase [Halosegnis sp.]|uniref:RsmB/NOP family class I SAM-dependent RNA methyltransferase n=1 Tax=Halosegnis sp. TaxID=2864959 RepID=UPI0035D4C510
MDDPLARYEPLIDDYETFRAACDRPLPQVVRVNTLKTSVDRAERALADSPLGYESVGWHDGLFAVDGKPGNTWPYVHGWLYGQEEVSALPGLICDPAPGERVFDPCAAPGSKTTHLAALMDDEGLLVANDSSLGRLSALRSNAEQCGLTNVAVTKSDARNFSLKPFDGTLFDRSVVDVPCSCEGTVRKNPDALDEWSLDHVEGVAGVQRGILGRAIEVTQAGGTVVYSTCTFAPEENEAVLDYALEEYDVSVRNIEVPLETRSGVTEWGGDTYDPAVARARRVYPHLNDTGGFFCAKLEVRA